MKKIVLLSDTHGYIDEKILLYAKTGDEIWHAGDIGTLDIVRQLEAIKPVRAVYGNIDGREIRNPFPLVNRFTIEGLDVMMIHIGGYPGHYDKFAKEILQSNPPQLFICGHSHILKVMRDKQFDMLCMNPGAAGLHGYHIMRTMLRFDIESGEIKNLEVIELDKRAIIQS